ncbi:DUF969 domain-containing protein [Peribacillus sp. SCS-155]|uniref:DUF969 domain-containing protein n=1 Tax=Peribacillus sedimenti TaxID=3115297 RepID=UPI003905AA08
MIKLIGIIVVALGFAFRFNTLLVVMVAGIVTGMVSGMSFNEVLSLFGQFFIDNRYMSLPIILTLPVIGILERYGLKERAETLIKKAKNATTGRVLLTYLAIREGFAAIGLNIGGHPQTVRPLVAPMAEGAAAAQYGRLSEKTRNDIKAHAAAAENTGWFFGEDIFIATGAILLMKGFFDSVGLHVGVWDMALWGIPTALSAFFISWFRFNRLDRRIAREARVTGTGAYNRTEGKIKEVQ